jgi:hypothetical protein
MGPRAPMISRRSAMSGDSSKVAAGAFTSPRRSMAMPRPPASPRAGTHRKARSGDCRAMPSITTDLRSYVARSGGVRVCDTRGARGKPSTVWPALTSYSGSLNRTQPLPRFAFSQPNSLAVWEKANNAGEWDAAEILFIQLHLRSRGPRKKEKSTARWGGGGLTSCLRNWFLREPRAKTH